MRNFKNILKHWKQATSVVLATALMVTGCYVPASAEETKTETDKKPIVREFDGVFVEKISNPTAGQGEIDGLIPGGDRLNNYAWCMTKRADKVYIGTIRGLSTMVLGQFVEGLVATGLEKVKATAVARFITKDEFDFSIPKAGGSILSVDINTGEIKELYRAGLGISFRNAITHGDSVYIGSYANNKNSIYRVDGSDNVEEIYSTESGTSMRASCEYEGDLYFGGVDSTEELSEECKDGAKLAILKLNESDFTWDRVADFSDFDPAYVNDPAMKSAITSPVWDIISYKGYIYATLPGNSGFVIYKGHPAADGEKANKYGWYWEEVVGKFNGVNNTGMAEKPEGYDGKNEGILSIAATPYVYKDKLYIFDFDNTLQSMLSAAKSILSTTQALDIMASTLKHSQKLWVLNDENGKFEEVESFNNLLKDTCNEYVWKAAVYNDELYITTMDAGVIYRYLTRFTDFDISKEKLDGAFDEIKGVAEAIKELDLLNSDNEKIAKFSGLIVKMSEMLEQSKEALTAEQMLSFYSTFKKLLDKFAEKASDVKEYASGTAAASDLVNDLKNGEAMSNDLIKILAALSSLDILNKIKTIAGAATGAAVVINEAIEKFKEISKIAIEAYNSIDWDMLKDYIYINKVVSNNVHGFDLLKSSDGVNFEAVFNDGLGDMYNYGGRTLCETETGLYIGTANPFYGAQLYRLSEKKAVPEAEVTTPSAVEPTEEDQPTAEPEKVPVEEPTVLPATVPAIKVPATKSAVTTPAATTASAINVSKKEVVVAPNKTVEVTYSITPDAASKAAVNVLSSNTNLVTVATEAGIIKITATAKSAKKKGKRVKVSINSGTASQIIKVAIRNKAKKVKPVKKTVTVKKGKKATVKFKIKKAENIKNLITDLFGKKAKKAAKIKKIAKVKKVKLKDNIIKVTLKAKKKGSAKLKLKLNKKAKASMKVNVVK